MGASAARSAAASMSAWTWVRMASCSSTESRPSAASLAPRMVMGSRSFQRSSSPSAPVLGRVGPGVAAIAVGLHLQQARAAAGARTLERLAHGRVHDIHVLAVDDDAGHAVRIGTPRQVDRRGGRHLGAVLAVQVVGDDEHHRRLPDGRHVERLVERADVGGPVPEERERAERLVLELERQRRTDRDGQARRPRWRWRRCCRARCR